MCGKTFLGPSQYKAFPMCQACYADAHGADMQTARTLKFATADIVGTTAGGHNLLLGPEGSRAAELWLAEAGIGRVLTVACHSSHLPRFDGVLYEVLDVDDDPGEDMAQHFPAAFAFIDAPAPNPARPHVLVHCVSGISRSGTVVVAYLMTRRRLGFNDALALARTGRPCVHPNSGFWRQLRELEADLRAQGAIGGGGGGCGGGGGGSAQAARASTATAATPTPPPAAPTLPAPAPATSAAAATTAATAASLADSGLPLGESWAMPPADAPPAGDDGEDPWVVVVDGS